MRKVGLALQTLCVFLFNLSDSLGPDSPSLSLFWSTLPDSILPIMILNQFSLVLLLTN